MEEESQKREGVVKLALRLIEIHGFARHYDVVYLKLSAKTRDSATTFCRVYLSVPDILIVLWPCKFDARG